MLAENHIVYLISPYEVSHLTEISGIHEIYHKGYVIYQDTNL